MSVQAGNNDYVHATGAVNVPIVDDKLAARLAVNMTRSDGWIENHNPAGEDLSSIDNYALRLSMLFEPTESTTAKLRLLHSRSNPTDIGVINYGTGPGGRNAMGVNPRVHPFTGRPFDAWEGYYSRTGGEIVADGSIENLLGIDFYASTLESVRTCACPATSTAPSTSSRVSTTTPTTRGSTT